MKKSLRELAALVEGAYVRGDENILVEALANDSREVISGTLFACLVGAHVDGHSFIEGAIKNGAVAVMTDKLERVPENVTALVLPDLEVALKVIAPFFYDYPSQKMRMIGITGTNGKTTTTYLLCSILKKAGYKVGVIGTIKILIEDEVLPVKNTTPDIITLQKTLARMVQSGIDYVVMEVSSHALDMERVAGCEFDTAVFTNLTQDHLDYHGNFENYVKAKEKLFVLTSKEGVKKNKNIVVNIDDKAGTRMLKVATCRKITYSVKNEMAVLKACDVEVLPHGAKLMMKSPMWKSELTLKITGMFNIYNVLAAGGAATAERIDPKYIVEALEEFDGVSGRFELVGKNKDFAIIVDYAHTPDGLENVLRTAREITTKNIITVFGCGGDRDRTKRPIMGALAAKLSDIVIVTSDNPRSENPEAILDDVMVGVAKEIGEKMCERIADRKEAIFKAVSLAKAGDTVLIAGKGHENYQILKDRTIHFDDKEIALEALEGTY